MHGFSPYFQVIFTSRASRADLGFWGYPPTNVAMSTVLRFFSVNVCGVPQPTPMHGFSLNFQDTFTPR